MCRTFPVSFLRGASRSPLIFSKLQWVCTCASFLHSKYWHSSNGFFSDFFFFSFSCSLTFFWINSIQSWLNTDFSTSSRWSSANSNDCSVLHSSKCWERLSSYLFSISWWSLRTCQPTGWEGQQELRRSREAKNWTEAFLPLLEASCLGRSK